MRALLKRAGGGTLLHHLLRRGTTISPPSSRRRCDPSYRPRLLAEALSALNSWSTSSARLRRPPCPALPGDLRVGDETRPGCDLRGCARDPVQRRVWRHGRRKNRLLPAKVIEHPRPASCSRSPSESLPDLCRPANGVSLALVIVVVAEMFIVRRTVWATASWRRSTCSRCPMYAAIFAAGALGYCLDLLFQLVERRVVHWSGR